MLEKFAWASLKGKSVVLLVKLMCTGGGTNPPDKKDGQRERSSGNDADEGDRCDKIAAASSSCTCWCLLKTNFEASCH